MLLSRGCIAWCTLKFNIMACLADFLLQVTQLISDQKYSEFLNSTTNNLKSDNFYCTLFKLSEKFKSKLGISVWADEKSQTFGSIDIIDVQYVQKINLKKLIMSFKSKL